MTSNFFNNCIFVHTFQWTSSEFFFLISHFLAESFKVNKKLAKKDYNTVSLKKPHLFYKRELTRY